MAIQPLLKPIGQGEVRRFDVDASLDRGQYLTETALCVAFAAASANIDIIRRNHLTENASRVGTYMMERLRELSEEDERIAEVRGRGLLIGVQLRHENGKTAKRLAHRVVRGCFKRGLLILTTGINEDVLRITPPLNFTIALADKTVDLIADSLNHS